MKKHTIYLLAISITEEMEGDGWVKQRVLTVVLMTIP